MGKYEEMIQHARGSCRCRRQQYQPAR